MAYVTSATANNVRRTRRRARAHCLASEREREREREKLAILAFPSFLQLSFRLAIEFRILQLRARSDAICRVRSDWPEEGGAAGGAIFN